MLFNQDHNINHNKIKSQLQLLLLTKINIKQNKIKKQLQLFLLIKVNINQKKNEPSKPATITNVVQSRSQIQRTNQPQPKDIKKTQTPTTPNQYKYQQRKYETAQNTNNYNTINNNNLNKRNEIKTNNQTIFSSRTTDNINKDTAKPKLKYYSICPNCGYHLNEESTVNNFNKTHTSGYNSGYGNRRDSYNAFDNKTFNKTDKKTSSYSIYNTENNNSNNRRHIYNNQINQKSMDNLKKEKDNNPSNNTFFYQSSYGTSNKSKYTFNVKK